MWKLLVLRSDCKLSTATITVLLLSASLFAIRAESTEPQVRQFLTEHCSDCHADGADEGNLALDKLADDLADEQTLATWIRVYDRVVTGEMPPEVADQPAPEEVKSFASLLHKSLSDAHAAQKGTVLRRLNRNEYENTMNDLFDTHLDFSEMLPEDGLAQEFDNVGESLSMSMTQIQRYMEAANLAMDASIVSTIAKPESKTILASYAESREVQKFIGDQWFKRKDGAIVFYRRLGYPTGMLREANTREAGFYRIRVTADAFQSENPISFSVGATTFARGAEQPTFGYFDAKPGKPQTIELTAWMNSGYMIQIEPFGIADDRNEIKTNGIANYKGPGLAISSVEIEGPLVDEFPVRGHRLIFDGVERREIIPLHKEQRTKSWYVPKFEVITEDPSGDANKILQRVASQAFRRPVNDNDLAPYLKLFEAVLGSDSTFEESLRTAVTAIFCSPEFLFFRESPGWLDDHALASRLSYFLTRTLPDEALMQSADSGELSKNRDALVAHLHRLLESENSERFINDFTDAWLDLRNIDFTSPDQQLFPEFDPFLRFSIVEETRMFFRELIEKDLPVGNIVKSDFAMLNNRLAELYEIDGVEGAEMRRVELPPDSPRGGLLTQASVLKVSANGTNTSPVVRGVWVMHRILGQTPPPPPPGISGVEPDIRGAQTLRDLLDKHRDLDSCRSCHQMIDPPGFALESFDPIGGWRDRFRSLGEGDRVDQIVDGRKVRYKLGPPVDASGNFPDGRTFDGFTQFRDLLAAEQNTLAKTLATKLLIFATGREMGFSDRAEIDRIVADSESAGHGVGNLIKLVVTSKIFRTK